MKKFLALAVSALMLIAMVPTAMAAENATVVMYEPVIFENNESASLGATKVPNSVLNTWGSYSNSSHTVGYQQEISGNKYLKIFNGTSRDATPTETGRYGATYYMDGSISEKAIVEFKVKIPRIGLNKDNYIRVHNKAYNGANTDNVLFSGLLTASVSGYYLRDESARDADVVKIADYNEQWITIKLELDTTAGTCKVLCDGVEKLTIAELNDLEDVALRCFQIRSYGEIHVDDLIVDTVGTAGKRALVYGSVSAPEYMVAKGDASPSVLIPASLVYADDSTAYSKTIGTVIESPDTSMPGTFKTAIRGFNEKATWNVYKNSEVMSWTFDETGDEAYPGYSYSNVTAGTNGVEAHLGSNALKIGATSASTRNYENIPMNIPTTKQIFDVSYDIHWEVPSSATTFYARVCTSSHSYPAVDIVHTLGSDGTYTIKQESTLIASGMVNKEKSMNIRFTTDRNGLMYLYIDDICRAKFDAFSTTKLGYLEQDLKVLDFYSYPGENKADVYIDNIVVGTYESVVTADRAVAPTTVVKGQPLKAYVTTTLTDGTTDKLPVVWSAIDTTNGGTATGTISGYTEDGQAVNVSAEITVIELPYTMNVADGTITITAPTDYTPAGKLYIATYEGGVLKGVDIYDTPVEGSTTVSASGDVKVFLLTDALVPLAEAID